MLAGYVNWMGQTNIQIGCTTVSIGRTISNIVIIAILVTPTLLKAKKLIKNYLGDLLERILCNVLRCIFNLRAVSETFLLHNSKTRLICSHLTLSADIGFSGGLAFRFRFG